MDGRGECPLTIPPFPNVLLSPLYLFYNTELPHGWRIKFEIRTQSIRGDCAGQLSDSHEYLTSFSFLERINLVHLKFWSMDHLCQKGLSHSLKISIPQPHPRPSDRAATPTSYKSKSPAGNYTCQPLRTNAIRFSKLTKFFLKEYILLFYSIYHILYNVFPSFSSNPGLYPSCLDNQKSLKWFPRP